MKPTRSLKCEQRYVFSNEIHGFQEKTAELVNDGFEIKENSVVASGTGEWFAVFIKYVKN